MFSENAQDWLVNYGYLALFIGTVLDHTGIPVFILAAGLLVSMGHLQFTLVVTTAYVAAFGTNVLLYIFGIICPVLNNRSIGNIFRKRKGLINNTIDHIFTVYDDNRLLLLLSCNIIPGAGKYVPFIAGNKREKAYLVGGLLAVNSLVYVFGFLVLGIVCGQMLLAKAKILAVMILIAILVVFSSKSYLLKRKLFSNAKGKTDNR